MTIHDAIGYYKENFSKCWEGEKYKWEAVQHFQDNWDINADDFAGMLEESFRFSSNLLSGGMYYPLRMICHFSKLNPKRMRELFQLLYNEEFILSSDHTDIKATRNHFSCRVFILTKD